MTEPSETAMIEAVGLSKYYGDFAAIDDVSFKVHRGEVVAFLGPERGRQKHDHEAAHRLSVAHGRRRPDRGARHGHRPAGRLGRAGLSARKRARSIPT